MFERISVEYTSRIFSLFAIQFTVKFNFECKNVNVIYFTHGVPGVTRTRLKCPCSPGSNWNLEMLVFFLGQRKTREPGERPLRAE